MTEEDVFYRAYGQLFKELASDPNSLKTVDAVAGAPDGDFVTVTHNVCHVDGEWISEIERGLVFVEKALEEDRQFIRTDGEVKPIEKVKHVSKESVRYLSRHSDLITREQKDDIIPDKLYTIEKESDHAVYENKFLYLLLCLIRDFVNVRYEAIAKAYKEYSAEYKVTKTVKLSSRELKFSFTMTDEQDDALFAPSDDECADAISRLNNITASVNFYLRTPIMQEVAKTDKIKGKITKTNVLLMDKNFFGAMKLYEYLRAYDSDGYTIEKRVDSLELTEKFKRELAIPPLLSAFVVYKNGLGLEKYLQEEFEKEELRRAEEEQKALKRKLAALKNRLERTGESIDDYILMLEKRNAIIENSYKLWQDALKDIDDLEVKMSRLQNEIDVLSSQIDELNGEVAKLEDDMRRAEEEHKKQLEETISKFEQEMSELKTKHEEEMSAFKAEHAKKLAELNAAHLNELNDAKQRAQEKLNELKRQSEEQTAKLNAAHKKEVENLRAEQKSRLEALQNEHAQALQKTRAEHEKQLAACMGKADKSAKELADTVESLAKANKELKFTAEERDVLKARLTAIRKEHGLLTEADDFTTEEGFNALEHEFEVLGKLLNDEWKDVKTMLRKEILGKRPARRKRQKSKGYQELKEFVESGREIPTSTETVGDAPPSKEAVDDMPTLAEVDEGGDGGGDLGA